MQSCLVHYSQSEVRTFLMRMSPHVINVFSVECNITWLCDVHIYIICNMFKNAVDQLLECHFWVQLGEREQASYNHQILWYTSQEQQSTICCYASRRRISVSSKVSIHSWSPLLGFSERVSLVRSARHSLLEALARANCRSLQVLYKLGDLYNYFLG